MQHLACIEITEPPRAGFEIGPKEDKRAMNKFPATMVALRSVNTSEPHEMLCKNSDAQDP